MTVPENRSLATPKDGTPRVSIVIPVYNGSNYLQDAIESALAQTWPNTEIIVVNDGSSDDGQTAKIARSYEDKIVYIEKPNGGVASALNAGIAAMTGEIFCWLSHDDRHLPEKTKIQVAEWNRRGRPDCIFVSDYRLIDKDGKKITEVRLDHELLTAKPLYALLRGSIHGCSVFVPRSLFVRVGLFDENLPTTQDYDLWLRAYRDYPFVHMPEILIESRFHDEQTSKKLHHYTEANDFWIRAAASIPENEQIELEGTPYQFKKSLADFLRANGLTVAANEIARRAGRPTSEKNRVSVVMPVFNRSVESCAAIESILCQTYSNIEIIVVDDGSTEDLSEIRQLLSTISGARLIVQENRGPGGARNAGWAAAQGEYVAFLDSDDLFLPSKISDQLEAMLEAKANFSHTSYQRLSGKSLTRIDAGARNRFPDIIRSCGIATPTVMVKRELWDEGFSFREDIRYGEDIILWIEIASRHNTFGVDKALSVIRTNSQSTFQDQEKLREGMNNILNAVMNNDRLRRYRNEVDLLRSMTGMVN